MPTARKTPALTRADTPTPAKKNALQGSVQSQRALALDVPVSRPSAPLAQAVSRLWFCAYLPYLPLEASGPAAGARVVVEEQQGMHRVLLACGQAVAAGIQPGQSVNAALALLPELRLEERCRLREQQAVETLAAWLEQFSSLVSIAARDILLLEMTGSLRLYGGLASLRRQIAAGLEQQGFAASLAIAPTPLAATWLARAGRRACVREPANLTAALRSLPLACLDWPAATGEAIRSMGATSVGDCLRLPREGFAKRFGPQRLIELDRALGRLPDPRTAWRAPETFRADYDMTEEQSDSSILLTICHELLQSLERFLLTRQLGTLQLSFSFFHLRAPATQLSLGSARPERLAAHWFDLLGIRFERLTFTEPVIAVRLDGGRNQALHAESGRLGLQGNADRRHLQYSVAQLTERLAARIGDQSVQGVSTVAEHRPHRAWRLRNLLANAPDAKLPVPRCAVPRPLWMLPEPAPLRAEQGQPRHHGPLHLLEGPERFETGWWDEGGVSRDYYMAVNPRGMRLWIFRNRSRSADWYLHGFFG